jgi:hypothetical protein
MSDITLIDETFDIHSTSTYHLSLQASMDGLTYCVLDLIRNKYIALKHYELSEIHSEPVYSEKIKEILTTDENINGNYKSVQLISLSHKSTLVPAPLFHKDNIGLYFEFNHPADKNEEITFNKIKTIDAYNIFSFPKKLKSNLKEIFPKIKLYHQATAFIENSFISHKNKKVQSRAFIHVTRNFFDILVITNNKLVLYNTFYYKNENDFIYFVMYIFEQFKLNAETTEVILSGEIDKTSIYFNTLRKFIRLIKFEKLNDGFLFSYIFKEITAHRFANLLNLYRCE